VADRTQQVATPAPVAELIAAWDARSVERFVAILAPGARVAVPPLHLELEGRDDVWLGVTRMFAAFGALRYTIRHRYLSPDAVTDEVQLEGLQTQEFLGAPPTGHPGSVAARVMLRHDGQVVTDLTVWPDVAALRELSDGVARRIDLRTAGSAAPVVAALRATIPAPQAKLSVGEGRQPPAPTVPPAEVTSVLLPGAPSTPSAGIGTDHGRGRDGESRGSGHEKGRKRPDVPKAPRSRKVRRLRAVVAGVAMLAVAGLLVTYVVQGVRRTRDVPAAAAQGPKPTATPTSAVGHARGAGPGPAGAVPPQSSSSSAPASTPAATPTFDPKTSSYTIPNTVLFAVNSATLLPDARNALEQVVEGVLHDKRYGRITVTGYTDSSGGLALNLQLSQQRAKAVALYLEGKLDRHFQLAYVGRGPANPRAANDTPEHMALNRRVEIKVPRPQP
jgi:outer membrane protein OmpA-like peptidoglycan-associated protein